MTKFYCCYKCQTVGSYGVDTHSGETTFPRGEWLVHQSYIVTGMASRQEARQLLRDDPYTMRPVNNEHASTVQPAEAGKADPVDGSTSSVAVYKEPHHE